MWKNRQKIKHDKQKVLNNINATFESGKIYAIVGESGSGKTTFLSLISALDKLQNGDIKYNNKSLRKIAGQEFRLKYVNIVFQSYNLIKYMTAAENVEVASDFDNRKIKAKSQTPRIRNWLNAIRHNLFRQFYPESNVAN